MIEDKKIEEAARYYCNNRYPASQDAPFIAEGFRHGAKWAINELFKNLWHPASEEPDVRHKLSSVFMRMETSVKIMTFMMKQ